MRPRRRVETCLEYLEAQRNGKSHAASTIKPKEREFVVDSGASMHMVGRKDLNSDEVETAKVSKSPTMVVAVNGEVLTKEESTVYVRQLDLFVTVVLLEDTLAVLSLGKTLRRSRVSLPLDQWSKSTCHQKWQGDQLQHSELRTLRCPQSIDKLFKLIFSYISFFFIAGSRNSYGASRINKK